MMPCSTSLLPHSPSLSSPTSKSGFPVATSLSMLIATSRLCGLLLFAFVLGCGSRTIFVPESSPMRIAEPNGVRMRVYHRVDGVWTRSENSIVVPEGWYLLPPSYMAEETK